MHQNSAGITPVAVTEAAVEIKDVKTINDINLQGIDQKIGKPNMAQLEVR